MVEWSSWVELIYWSNSSLAASILVPLASSQSLLTANNSSNSRCVWKFLSAIQFVYICAENKQIWFKRSCVRINGLNTSTMFTIDSYWQPVFIHQPSVYCLSLDACVDHCHNLCRTTLKVVLNGCKAEMHICWLYLANFLAGELLSFNVNVVVV